MRFPTTAAEICKIVSGVRYGRNCKIIGIIDPDRPGPDHLVFLFDKRQYHLPAACLVVRERIDHPATQIVVPDPRFGLYLLLEKIEIEVEKVQVGRGVTIGPYVVIGSGVAIGDGSKIGPFTQITYARIGRNVKIGGGCLIGRSGFSLIKRRGRFLRIRHIGNVVIRDGAEIGSNCTIDRGTFTSTEIGARTRIDSSVHIGHNVRIGKDCTIVAQVGIAGSTRIGHRTMIAGQVGIKDGVEIGDNCRVLAKAGVFKSFPTGSTISGIPARDHRKTLRIWSRLSRMEKTDD
ncbi:MAG TPA: UDP-3-O-(3-hydroxymyristoyl)glucosamine N-acyltransferase [bacterium (Candidatus Stahlbacteria)]|nr:UDP-3-O-(3-hydroxymyristoyl)glucosamine N-acyltransferase [Candidatus Stahlbacteria bacterium]